MANELRPVDADNHYYEALDAFTRHLDPKYEHRGVKAVLDGTHVQILIAGKVNHFIPNPTFDPVIVPGCLDIQFRGQIPEGVDPRTLTRVEPISASYRDRDARIATMDDQAWKRGCCSPRSAVASNRRSGPTFRRRWRACPHSTVGSRTTGVIRIAIASSPRR